MSSLVIFYLLLFSFFLLIWSFFLLSESNLIYYHSMNLGLNIFLIFLLIYSFLLSDFSLYIVLINSYSIQDIFYKLFGLWCSHEGSLLFWSFCFHLYIFITFLYRLPLGLAFYKGYYFVLILLVGYLILFSNPCTLLNFFIFEGLELNFLLHNPLVSIHPPFLYVGYLFTVFLFVYFIYFL